MAGRIYLGTQSWSNKNWRGNFYPSKIAPQDFLKEYAKTFKAVEIDSTFYAVPRAAVVEQWYASTPNAFRFAAKFPGVITHEKVLKDVEIETQQFLQTMVLLKEKLGLLVLQFPFNFRTVQRDRLIDYLAALPTEFRYAVEVRHPDWFIDAFYDVLKKHRIALVLADYGKMPSVFPVTADFTYIRLVGNRRDFPSGPVHTLLNRDAELNRWSETITQFAAQDIDVWAFANDVYQGHAPTTMQALSSRVQAIEKSPTS